MNQVNIAIFHFINQFAGSNPILDETMIILAKYLSFIFIFILICFWFKKGYKNIVLYSGYSAILGILLNFLITLFYFHPRPFMEDMGPLLINHAPGTSFPSDHTTLMLSVAFMLLYFKKTRALGVILSLLGLTGGIARIYCGVHFPFDILGSFFVAIISSYIIFLTKVKLQKLNKIILNLMIGVRRKN